MGAKRKICGRVLVAALAALMCVVVAGCGSSTNSASSSSESSASSKSSSAEPAKLGIAYQYGLGYAPAVIAKEKGFIEERYKEATGNELEIEWSQISTGADINTGITSGSLDAGFMGFPPAVTGITNGLDYKIFTNLSGQEHGLMTNDETLTSLSDLVGSDDQISLVNIGSTQHLMLAKALVDNGYDAHELDASIVAMKQPDGVAAVTSGTIACHLTSSPYIFTERADSSLHELPEVNEAWTRDDPFTVGIASNALHDDEALYQALCDGISDAQQFIVDSPEEAAAILCELDGISAEEELEYLQQGKYSAETKNLFAMTQFMADNGFIDVAPDSYSSLVFDNVKGD